MPDSRYLCLYLPHLATDRTRRGQAAPGQTLVLTSRVGSSLVVEGVDAQAARLGARPGMSLAQAQAIVPELLALPHEPQRDIAALRQLASWALRFSPLVQPAEPDTLLIDITGCQRLFSGEDNIARQAVQGLAQQGFQARAAVADTVGAACALASSRVDPVTIAPSGQTLTYLVPLPPAALRIDARVSERLESLGVRTIGDLLRLPRPSLPSRFGPQLVLRLQQALGEVFEGVGAYEPEEIPRSSVSFDQPAREWPALQPAADQLLADVFVQLHRSDRALRRLDCVLAYERTPPLTLAIGLSRPSRSARHTGVLLAQRLEQVDLSAGVCGLVLIARQTARWRAAQPDLFEQRQPDEEEDLGSLVDHLRARLGDDAVLRPQLLDDYQPELAFRYVTIAEAGMDSRVLERQEGRLRLAPPPVGSSPSDKAEHPHPPERPRPLRLLPRPILIRVIALLPDGPPSWFAYGGHECIVAAAEGPERLETAWWRGPDVRRDYFRLTAEDGQQFWVFHALDDQRWYLHGIFA